MTLAATRWLLCTTLMDMTQRVAAGTAPGNGGVGAAGGVAGLDGSPASRMRLARARAAYSEAEAQALKVISTRALEREARGQSPSRRIDQHYGDADVPYQSE